MRILLLSQFYSPVIGGEERHIASLSEALASRGHEVSVLSLPHPERDEVVVERGVEVRSVKGLTQRCTGLFSEAERPHATPFPDPELSFRIGRLIAEMKPDVVHGHNWMSRAFLPCKRYTDSGFVVTLHDYSLVCARKNLMHKGELCSGPGFVKCLTCASEHFGPVIGSVTSTGNWATAPFERRMVDHYIAVSASVANKCGLAAGTAPFEVLPTFIPDNIGTLSSRVDARLSQLPEDGYLLFVGDLTEGKGIRVLLQSYATLTNAPPLVLIGRVCADTPKELPPNVTLIGGLPHAAVMHAWSRCAFGIAPSVWAEACGTIVMEGNAVGKAMIATASGGLSDLIDPGRTGLLVPPRDPIALAGAMQTLIDNPARREAMGAAAKLHVERFMAKTIVPRIEKIYRELSLRSAANRQDLVGPTPSGSELSHVIGR